MRAMSSSQQRRSTAGRTLVPALACGAAVFGLLVAPAAAGAFSSGFDSQPVSLAARGGIGSFTPASVDPRLASRIKLDKLSRAQLFRFTPAGSSNRPDRSVTVAVRVDTETARAVSVRSTLAAAAGTAAAGPGTGSVRIAPTAFNLGMARGFDSFAQKLTTPAEVRRLDMPDLAAFDLGRGERGKGERGKDVSARFATHVEVDEDAKPGRAPRTLEGQGDYSVDVGGSYRVSGNVAVTAGVRYRSERDRIAPLTDSTQDSQAVYVGTQFRF